jgi:hypothetical protein
VGERLADGKFREVRFQRNLQIGAISCLLASKLDLLFETHMLSLKIVGPNPEVSLQTV